MKARFMIMTNNRGCGGTSWIAGGAGGQYHETGKGARPGVWPLNLAALKGIASLTLLHWPNQETFGLHFFMDVTNAAVP